MKHIKVGVAMLAALAVFSASIAEAKCGSRGGPGYRQANGKCASHRR
jgi:hypothetical protein